MNPTNVLLEAIGQTFDEVRPLSIECEDGKAFKDDFSRTYEIELIIDGKSCLHYIKASSIKEKAEQIRNDFKRMLREERPELERAIEEDLHQGGRFYSGEVALNRARFPGVAIEQGESTHKFIIEVRNKDEVTIKEVITYNSLILHPVDKFPELRDKSDVERKSIKKYRNAVLSEAKKAKEVKRDKGSDTVTLLKPLSVEVCYHLCYSEEARNYVVQKPSENDIVIKNPSTFVEKLVFGDGAERAKKEFKNKTTKKAKFAALITKFTRLFSKPSSDKPDQDLTTKQQSEYDMSKSFYMNRFRP